MINAPDLARLKRRLGRNLYMEAPGGTTLWCN